MNGGADPKEIDPESLELIREVSKWSRMDRTRPSNSWIVALLPLCFNTQAYNELLEEMSSVDIDEKAIKSMMDPKAFDGP